jgi:anti-sigma B factor antagonist
MGLKQSTLDNGIGLIEPSGSLIGGPETDNLRRAIADFAGRDYSRLLIDLSSVTYLNSTAIGVLVSGLTTYSKKGWQLKLCGINKNIDSIFVITKLSLAFDVHDTRKEALAAFS